MISLEALETDSNEVTRFSNERGTIAVIEQPIPRKLPSHNKIHESKRIREVVHEYLRRNTDLQEICDILNDEYEFSISYPTVKRYYKYYWLPLVNDTASEVKLRNDSMDKLEHETKEILFRKGLNYIEYLEQTLNFHEKKVDMFENMINKKKTEAGKMKGVGFLESMILKHMEAAKEVREKLSEVKEGPQGQVVRENKLVSMVMRIATDTLYEVTKEADKVLRNAFVTKLKANIRSLQHAEIK